MKTILHSIVLIVLTCLTLIAGDAPPSPSPQYPTLITCFNGKVDSRNYCSSLHTEAKGKVTCGHPGKVSEIQWVFIGKRGTNDVYQFTRRFPVDSGDLSKIVTSKREVEFSNKRVLVFEDQHQIIVIDPVKK